MFLPLLPVIAATLSKSDSVDVSPDITTGAGFGRYKFGASKPSRQDSMLTHRATVLERPDLVLCFSNLLINVRTRLIAAFGGLPATRVPSL